MVPILGNDPRPFGFSDRRSRPLKLYRHIRRHYRREEISEATQVGFEPTEGYEPSPIFKIGTISQTRSLRHIFKTLTKQSGKGFEPLSA